MAAVVADTPDNRFKRLLSNPTTIIVGSEKLDLIGVEVATSLLSDYYKLENSACFTQNFNMITYVSLGKGRVLEQTSGIYSYDVLERIQTAIGRDSHYGTMLSGVFAYTDVRKRLDSNVELIGNLKKQYPECRSPFLYIPLTLIPLDTTNIKQSYHANGILIGRNGTVFRIEPQFDPKISSVVDEGIKSAIVDIANKIGLRDPRFVELNDVCPQAITLDKNCIFWTLFIMNEILRNMYKIKDPNDVIKLYVSKPKPELDALIKNFKIELITKIIPGALASRKMAWPDFEEFRKKYPEYIGGKNGFNKTRKNNRIKNGRKPKQNRRRRTRRKGNSQASNVRHRSKFTS
jgi:hypothetical protein